MQMINTIIIEDEPLVRDHICYLLGMDESIKIVASCTNGVAGLQAISNYLPELIFLDIQMPGKNGFEVLENLPTNYHPIIIFVTAFDQYAVKAFEFGGTDYLLKPFNQQRFFDSVSRAKERLTTSKPQSTEYPSFLLAKKASELIPVPVNEICWITNAGNYALLHTSNQQFSTRRTLKELEEVLNPKQFRRIHRSTIVQIKCISRLSHLYQGDYRIELTDGKLLTSSKKYRVNVQFILNVFRA